MNWASVVAVLAVVGISTIVWIRRRTVYGRLTRAARLAGHGRYDDAERLLSKIEPAIHRFGVFDYRNLWWWLEKARLLAVKGDVKQAAELIQLVLVNCEHMGDPYADISSRALLNLAEASATLNDDEEAERLYLKTIKYRQAAFGEDSKAVALAINRYADFLVVRLRMDESKKWFDRAQQILRLPQVYADTKD